MSLLPILVPARDVRSLPERLATIVGARLERLRIDADIIARETHAMAPVAIRPTIDRSVLGIMVDFAKAIPFYLERAHWDDAPLTTVEDRLGENPCFASRSFDETVFPNERTELALRSKWRPN